VILVLAVSLSLGGIPSVSPTAVAADPAPNQLRFGVATNKSPHEYTNFYQLNAGWYHNWIARPWNNQAVGNLQFVPTVGAWGDLMGSETEDLLRAYVRLTPASYPSGTIWIVGNELDLDTFSTPQGNRIITPDEYAQKYKKYYDIIKGIDSSFKVGVGCEITSAQLLSRARQAYEARYGAKMPIDVYTMHAYLTTGTDLLTQVKLRTRYTRQLMKDYGDQDKWLIVTETGALSDPGEQIVKTFMEQAFDYYANTTDPQLGAPSDGYRLVQRWAWFAMTAWDPSRGKFFWQGSKLLGDTAPGELTLAGTTYANMPKSPPTLPSSFWGTVTINGANVPDGTVVTAWAGNTQLASDVTRTINGASVYTFDILADDPNTTAKDGAVHGEQITFKMGALPTSNSAMWQSGMSVNVDLVRYVYSSAPASWLQGYGVTAGGWTDQNTFPRLLGDVNGDGKADIVAFGNNATYVSLSSGTRFNAAHVGVRNYGVTAGGWTSQDAFPRLLGDVNGDGRDDIVAFGNRAVYVSLSNGIQFGVPTPWIGAYGVSAGGWSSQDRYPRALGDVNGDGKTDIVAFGENGTFVSLSTGSGFTAPATWVRSFGRGEKGGWWTSQNTYPRMVADVNGDGRDDIIGFGNNATYVALSTGSGFTTPTEWIYDFGVSPTAGSWTSYDLFPRTVADMNGDGKADIVGFGRNGVQVASSTGTSFRPPVMWVENYGTQAGGWSNYNIFPRVVGDLNGDGRNDIVGFGNKATYASVTASGKLSLALATMLAAPDAINPWAALFADIPGVELGPDNLAGVMNADEIEGGWLGEDAGMPDEELPLVDSEADEEPPLPVETPTPIPQPDTPRAVREGAEGRPSR
jgi:hypothetical protein